MMISPTHRLPMILAMTTPAIAPGERFRVANIVAEE